MNSESNLLLKIYIFKLFKIYDKAMTQFNIKKDTFQTNIIQKYLYIKV